MRHDFNPRVPCGTRRRRRVERRAGGQFQPTRPLRDATRQGAQARGLSVFQPTRPLRDATQACPPPLATISFQPTRPLRDATSGGNRPDDSSGYFNPRVPCGTRRMKRQPTHPQNAFQPTRPLRDATVRGMTWEEIQHDFNPRVPCGTRQAVLQCARHHLSISTHASLAGRDLLRAMFMPVRLISTHASLAGRDDPAPTADASRPNFNPRVPCGTRQKSMALNPNGDRFQPTRPLRDATGLWLYERDIVAISTHASLAGRDGENASNCDVLPYFNPRVPCGTRRRFRARGAGGNHFNPRVPCGTRPSPPRRWANRSLFQPTRPLRDATSRAGQACYARVISTHASLAGRDATCSLVCESA